MKTRARITRKTYAVDLTLNQFIAVETRDDRRLLKGPTLLDLLSKKGVHSIEYSGHFGASIFYTVDVEDDTEEFRAEVEKLIVDYANGKRMED